MMPLVKINTDNSSLLCGDIISMILKSASSNRSFMREYRKKLYEILAENSLHLARLIISSYTSPVDRSITSSNMKVGRHDADEAGDRSAQHLHDRYAIFYRQIRWSIQTTRDI